MTRPARKTHAEKVAEVQALLSGYSPLSLKPVLNQAPKNVHLRQPSSSYVIDASYPELRALYDAAVKQTDSLGQWEAVVNKAVTLEGGLNRNTPSSAISSYRAVYDRLLQQMPLLFGYWSTYAKHEFSVAGTEQAEMVYERAIASIKNSVDLWVQYCDFKVETCHDNDVIRELFERAIAEVGIDYYASEIWDKYIEFEARNDASDRIYGILKRLVPIPQHHSNRYYDRLVQMQDTQPLDNLADSQTLVNITNDVMASYTDGRVRPEAEKERDIRVAVMNYYAQIHDATKVKLLKCWEFEQNLKRMYFHTDDLEASEVQTWHSYLDYEESLGNHARIVYLYERCLVPCAYYPEFWMRYLRYMYPVVSEEDMRILYTRITSLFAPIARPEIRHHFALFEEQAGRAEAARTVYQLALAKIPGDLDTIVAWANFERRVEGVDAAMQFYRDRIFAVDGSCSAKTEGKLLGHMGKLAIAFPKRESKDGNTGADSSYANINEVRQLFEGNFIRFANVPEFWQEWLQFEADAGFAPLPSAMTLANGGQHSTMDGGASGAAKSANQDGHEDGALAAALGHTTGEIRVRKVWNAVKDNGRLSLEAMQAMFLAYKNFLLERGTGKLGAEARVVMVLDGLLLGPDSLREDAR